MSANNSIAKSLKLDLEPMNNAIKAAITTPIDENDYDEIRSNLHSIISEIQSGPLVEILSLASQSQKSDHYKVVSDMFRVLVDANKTLIDLNQRRYDITGQTPTKAQTSSTNIVVVGTTADLLKMFKDASKETSDIITIEGANTHNV